MGEAVHAGRISIIGAGYNSIEVVIGVVVTGGGLELKRIKISGSARLSRSGLV